MQGEGLTAVALHHQTSREISSSRTKQCLEPYLQDEAGFVVSTELVLIATILVIGLIVGQTTLRDQVSTELADTADAISAIDQSYE